MRRILIVFCTAAALYLSVSYWYLPNSPYSKSSLDFISSRVIQPIAAANIYFHKFLSLFSDLNNLFLGRVEINKRLKKLEKIEDELQQTKIELNRYQSITKELKSLTNFHVPEKFKQVSVSVYGAPIGFYDAQLITASPPNVTIKKDDVAVNEKGLIGRVSEASSRLIRIMLITDMASRVPVKILETGENAMIIGNGTATMSLKHLQSREMITNNYKHPPKIGDIVVTSGIGGIYPADIPVGMINAIKDEEISVKPFVIFHTLEIIAIIYGHVAL